MIVDLYKKALFKGFLVIMVPTTRFELVTSSLPWNCSTIGAMSAFLIFYRICIILKSDYNKNMKIIKTNAMRQLDRLKIPYHVYTYDTSDGFVDGVSVAEKCGQEKSLVYKTLVTRALSQQLYVFVIEVQDELDLKKCARVVHEKSVELVHVNELLGLTGYVRGGCSPIAMKKNYPIIVSSTIQNIDSIIFSGGKIGIQIHCRTQDFLSVTHARIEDVVKRNSFDD